MLSHLKKTQIHRHIVPSELDKSIPVSMNTDFVLQRHHIDCFEPESTHQHTLCTQQALVARQCSEASEKIQAASKIVSFKNNPFGFKTCGFS